VTGRKSEANGVSEQEAPASKTIGRVGARVEFGWSKGIKSEVAVRSCSRDDCRHRGECSCGVGRSR